MGGPLTRPMALPSNHLKQRNINIFDVDIRLLPLYIIKALCIFTLKLKAVTNSIFICIHTLQLDFEMEMNYSRLHNSGRIFMRDSSII